MHVQFHFSSVLWCRRFDGAGRPKNGFMPRLAWLIGWLGWTGFHQALSIGEMSSDAGGLTRWPIRLAIPLGFLLLALQGFAEAIKRAAFLFDDVAPDGEERA